MANAQCSCGALTVALSVPATRVLACHCLDCQRVTGSPFLLAAFYPAEAVTVSGSPKEFTRSGGSGATVHQYFCSNCGSTIYWKNDARPGVIGVAVGTMADPKFPAPTISIFEQSKHDWVQIGSAVEHYQQRISPKSSS